MSRAFVNEDAAGWGDPSRRVLLPERGDPGFDTAAAAALLDAALTGNTDRAELLTGYFWGEPRLHVHVRRILERARVSGDARLAQVAERFLR